MGKVVDALPSPSQAGTGAHGLNVLRHFAEVHSGICFQGKVLREIISEGKASAPWHTPNILGLNRSSSRDRYTPTRIQPLIADKNVGFRRGLFLSQRGDRQQKDGGHRRRG